MEKNNKKTIAFIFGGEGFEHDISLRGASFALPLADREKYGVLPIYISRGGIWFLLRDEQITQSSAASPLCSVFPAFYGARGGFICSEGKFIPADAAFILLHGDRGEDGVVQGALAAAHIPFAGCSVEAGALCADKRYTKAVAEYLGIPSAKMYSPKKGESPSLIKLNVDKALSYPVFIKPARLGSSVGIERVGKSEELIAAIQRSRECSDTILIEEGIDVESELEVAYYSVKSKEIFTNIGKITPNYSFYDYKSKYEMSDGARIEASADITDEDRRIILDHSERLASFIGLCGMSRIDFFKARDGKIYFNEINTIPGFTGASLYPRLVSDSGISPSELINSLIESALSG